MLSWFDTRKAKEFGNGLARSFIERMPLDVKLGEKAFAQKADKVLVNMTGQVLRFRQEYPLNPYKKAHLGNAFKWALRDAGFSTEYADKLTQWLMLQLP